MDLSHPIRGRRQHAREFKQGLVTLCQPGTSVSAVALEHGVNANLLRRWIKQFSASSSLAAIAKPAKLVPVQVNALVESTVNDAIEISIQKGRARVSIRWPGSQASACGQWLTDLLE
jgi:transposase